jgi:hypothetical protein
MVEAPPIGTKISAASPSSDPRFTAPVEPTNATTTVAALPQGANVPMPRPAPRRSGSYVTAAPSSAPAPSSPAFAFAGGGQSGGEGGAGFSGTMIGRAASSVGRVFGFGGEEAKPTSRAAEPTRQHRVQTARKPQPRKPAATAAAPKSVPEPQSRTAQATPPASTGSTNMLPGAQPVLPTGGFENRWPSSGLR